MLPFQSRSSYKIGPVDSFFATILSYINVRCTARPKIKRKKSNQKNEEKTLNSISNLFGERFKLKIHLNTTNSYFTDVSVSIYLCLRPKRQRIKNCGDVFWWIFKLELKKTVEQNKSGPV